MEEKYVGLDVHQSMTVGAVHDEIGRSVMEAVVKTEAKAVGDFLRGLSGRVHVTFGRLSIKLCLGRDSPGLLKPRLEQGIELR